MLSDNGLVNGGILPTDTYESAKAKSVDSLVAEDNYNDSLCAFYDTFSLCTSGSLPEVEEQELTSVEVFPSDLTVGELVEGLNIELPFTVLEDGPGMGEYAATYYYNGQSYHFGTKEATPGSTIDRILIK